MSHLGDKVLGEVMLRAEQGFGLISLYDNAGNPEVLLCRPEAKHPSNLIPTLCIWCYKACTIMLANVKLLLLFSTVKA